MACCLQERFLSQLCKYSSAGESALDILLLRPAPVEYKTEPAKIGSISNEVTLTGQIIAESEQNL
jgi:hypothetical protein